MSNGDTFGDYWEMSFFFESRTSSNYGIVISRILIRNNAPNLASHEMEWLQTAMISSREEEGADF